MRFTRITPVQEMSSLPPSSHLIGGPVLSFVGLAGCRDFAVVVGGSKGLAGFAGAWLRPAGF